MSAPRFDPPVGGPVPESLAGGVANAGEVVRQGDIVLRPAPANASTLHRLLKHVVDRGFVAPDPLEIRADGREAVVYIPGDVSLPPYPEPWSRSNETLVEVGRLLRRYHDAAKGFVLEDTEWNPELADPCGGGLVCHNDVCIENVVFRDRRAVGLLDFDFAAPGRPVWDVAMTGRYWVPLLDPMSAEATGRSDLDVFTRLRALVDAYGLDEASRQGFGAVLMEIEEVALRFVLGRIDRGEAAFMRMWNDLGGEERHERKMRWLEEHLPRIEETLSSG